MKTAKRILVVLAVVALLVGALAVSAFVFGVLCVCTMIAAKKGAEKWTI